MALITPDSFPWSENPLMTDSTEKAMGLLLTGKTDGERSASLSGFSSLRALDQSLKKTHGITSKAFGDFAKSRSWRFEYGTPFHLPRTLQYLGRDPENRSELLIENRLTRFLPINGKQIRAEITLEEKACEVRLFRACGAAEVLAIHQMVRRLLGLNQPLEGFYQAVKEHPQFGPLTRSLKGVRIPQTPDLWEAMCWAIVGQQINLVFAYRLRNRLILMGNQVEDLQAVGKRPYRFPTPEQVLSIPDPLWKEAQFSRQKKAYLGNLARAFLEGPLGSLSLERDQAGAAEAAMISVKGIGRWSSAYGLMRGLGYMDALPVGDTGLRTALQRMFSLQNPPDMEKQEKLMEPFRPYRSLASYYLWKSLDTTANE